MMKWKCLWCLIFLGSWENSSLGNGKLSIKVGSGASGLKEFQRTNRPQRSTLFSTFSKQFLHIRKWIPMVGCLYPSNRFMFFPHSIHFLFFWWWSSSDWFIGASPFFSTISLIQFFSCFVVRVGMAVVWAYTKGITMKKTTSCWHPFLFRVFSSSQSFCFYGVVFIFWEKRFIKGNFSSRYSIKTYEMMVRFLSPIFLYDQMCLNTFLLQMNWLYMIHQLIKKNN